MRSGRHEPVLFQKVVELLRPVSPDGVLVDATVGLGGHTEGLLRRYEGVRVLGIDRDPEALRLAGERLSEFGERVRLVCGRHEELFEILNREGMAAVDGVLADLGVSSMQLDDPGRGFSFRFEGPLDMRMGLSGESAADLVNSTEEAELARIIRDWGEEPMARRIARAIVTAREEERIETTSRLAEVIRSVKKKRRGDEIDPATKTFQAIRIATNRELVELETFVDAAVARTRVGGRVAVISFHSLEDRIVKQAFRRLEGECTCPPGMPVCGCGARQIVRKLSGRPMIADEAEVEANARSRSAKLRVVEKVAEAEEQG